MILYFAKNRRVGDTPKPLIRTKNHAESISLLYRKNILDNPAASDKGDRVPLPKGTSTGDIRLMERVRFLRAGLVTPLPGGPGIDPLDTRVGVPGAWLRRER